MLFQQGEAEEVVEGGAGEPATVEFKVLDRLAYLALGESVEVRQFAGGVGGQEDAVIGQSGGFASEELVQAKVGFFGVGVRTLKRGGESLDLRRGKAVARSAEGGDEKAEGVGQTAKVFDAVLTQFVDDTGGGFVPEDAWAVEFILGPHVVAGGGQFRVGVRLGHEGRVRC